MAPKKDETAEKTPAAEQEATVAAEPKDETSSPEGPTIDPTDPDDIELVEAQKALEAEEGAKAGEKTPGTEETSPPKTEPGKPPAGEAEPTTQAATEPAKAVEAEGKKAEPVAGEAKPEAPKAEGEPPMIPKPRFDQVLADREQAISAAAYWRGVAEARGTVTQPGVGEQETPAIGEPAKTVDEQLAEVRTERIKLATRFDDGEMSAKEWEESRAKLEDKEREIRSSVEPAPAAPAATPAPQPTSSDDLYLDNLTTTLEDQHPFTLEIDEKDPRWAFLETEAWQQLGKEGVDITPDSRGTYVLRQRMAELTDVYGPIWTGKTSEELKKAKAEAEPKVPEQQPPGNSGEQPSKTAKAREAKLIANAEAPPDVSRLGAGGAQTEVSDAQIEGMTDEEIAALPEATRRRLMPTE